MHQTEANDSFLWDASGERKKKLTGNQLCEFSQSGNHLQRST